MRAHDREKTDKNVNSLEEMISLARELGVRMIACEMSRELMGIEESELVAGLECGGVGSFLADSLKSWTSCSYDVSTSNRIPWLLGL